MKVLFITSTRLGDAILSTGLLNHILKQYPQAQVTVACGPLPVSIFEGFPNVVEILAMKKEKRHGHWVKLWKKVVSAKWDMVVDLRDSAVSRVIRAKQRYIFSKHIDKTKHKCEQAAQVMGLEHIPAPILYFTEAQNKFAQELIPSGTPVIGVGPSANWIGKTWPADRFMEVIHRITAENGVLPKARVAVFAAPGEEEPAQAVLNSVLPEDRQINGIAKGTPGEVAAAIARCDLFIGNDSGLMHAAAATKVPTVGLFGPSYPHLYAPWGAHTTYAQTPETFDQLIDFEGYSAETLDKTLMTSLLTDDVMNIIKAFWQDSRLKA